MAKFFGNSVKTGRLGSSVFRVRAGETIESQYQPNVANPSTPNQIAVRAKMKLMSQLSAVMAPAIAIAPIGNKSSRNLFTKENFAKAIYVQDGESGHADVSITDIQLTKSVVGMGSLFQVSRADTTLVVGSSIRSEQSLTGVIYNAFVREADGRLLMLQQVDVKEGGNEGIYPATITLPSASATVYVLAYGYRLLSEKARVAYGNVENGVQNAIATLVASRILLSSDIQLTETRGLRDAIA